MACMNKIRKMKMSEYTPDKWIILEMETQGEDGPICKVFGNWYGGFAGSDSWKLSSGITKIVEHEDHYEIHNVSGSIYDCFKHAHGVNFYGSSVLNRFMEQAKKSDGKYTIKEIDISEVRTIV